MSLSQSTVRTLEPGPEDWLEEFGDMLFSFAKRRVNNSAAAEDLVQETLNAGINGLDSFSGISNIGSWLKGILRNKIFDYYRKQRRDRMSSGVATEKTAERREFDFLGTWRRDPGLWNDSPEAALD
jgi:RNA polymerase sigma-70 factor (ECF subfamily)